MALLSSAKEVFMTRTPIRNYSLSVVAASVAILTLLIAAAALAQVPDARLRFAQHTASAMQQNTGVPGRRLGHPVMMRTPNAELTSAIPPLRFSKPIPYDPGGSATSIAVADVNGDGHLDLVVAYWNEGSVGVLLGKGDGTFQPVVKYDSGGTGAPSVAVADINGDGKPDIVVLNAWLQEGAVSVLRGNGDGTFQPPVFYPSGGYDNVSVTIQDGLLVVINLCWDEYCDYPNGNVCVNGSCYDSGGMNPYSVAVGDLNGDGHPDIVVGNMNPNPNGDPSMTLGVLLNDGWGGFLPVVLYDPGGDYPYLGAVADLNGDGKPDIVVAPRSGTSVLLGNGDGTVQAPVIVGPLGGSLIAADLNGNGKPDLIGIGAVMLNTSGFATATHVTTSLNPSFTTQAVTLTATVTSKSRTIPDGELVTFYEGKTILASVALAGGVASYTTS